MHDFKVGGWLLWAKPNSTWSHPVSAVAGLVLMEFGDFVMLRRMLRGIKVRAELVTVKRGWPQAAAGDFAHNTARPDRASQEGGE